MKVLHIEDDENDAEIVRRLLVSEWPHCHLTWVASRDALVRALHGGPYDVILSDYALPSFDGPEALRLAKLSAPETPFIFVSGTIGEDRAIEAMRLGADDYVLKDRLRRLLMVLPRTLASAAERRQRLSAEARIQELGTMLDQAREAIYITDIADRVVYWNSGAEQMFGWTAAEAVGAPADACVAPVVGAATAECRVRRNAEGVWAGELQVHRRTGEVLIIESRQSLTFDQAGRPKGWLCISSDITARKRLEDQFLRAQRLENLGLLAAGIAHDLNNMLAPILLATPMLRDQATDATSIQLLDTLERSAERGAHLVRQILSFAHGVAGEQHLVQAKHLLRDIAGVITGTFPKSIRLHHAADTDLWPITGNPTQVHQVLLNLCVNARDAMPEGGTLRLTAANRLLGPAEAARLPGARPGPFVLIEVSDTGTGIPPELLKRIWEPFFTTKAPGAGTGLGLSTVRGIVQGHQGFIDVGSAAGQGTTFRIYLPAAASQVPDAVVASLPLLQRGKGELILVVDDEEQIREMIAQMLDRQGYRVIEAADGIDATAVFAHRAAEIKLVISDLHMPNLDGAKFGRALRRINPASRLLVVSGLASGLGNREDYRPEEFADALLMKPFKADVLLELVHELLSAPARTSFVVR